MGSKHSKASPQPEEDKGDGKEQAPVSAAEKERIKHKIRHAVHRMKKSPEKLRVQRQGCSKFRDFCTMNLEFRSLLVADGGLEALKEAMSNHGRSVSLLNCATRVLALVAKTNSTSSLSMAPLLLEIMQKHKRNAYLQLNALTALCHWACAENGEQEAVQLVNEYGAYEVVWAAMSSSWHEFNPMVQDKALKALLLLTQHKENRPPFVTAAGWKALLTCQKNHKKHLKIQAKCLKIFKNMTPDHPVAVAKRLSPILQTMQWHLLDETIQRHGCTILSLLVAADHDTCREWLHKVDARDALVAAMNQHKGSEEIQKTAILALQQWRTAGNTNHHGNWQHEGTRANEQYNNTGDLVNMGLEAMVASLNDTETKPATVANICKALVKLAAASHSNKMDIAACGGVEAIVQAMGRHQEIENLQRYGCQALTQLAAVQTNKLLIVDLKGPEAIYAAMDQHGHKNHLVPLNGILALLRLSQNTTTHDKLIEGKAVEAIVQAMRAHGNHATLQHKSIVVFGKLALSSTTNKRIIVQAGGFHAILDAMTAHATHEHIQRTSLTGISNLHHRDTSMDMVQAGALHAVVAAMKKHMYKSNIQMAALKAIKAISVYAIHHPNLAESGGIRAVVLTMKTHLEDSNLQQLAFTLLLRCSERDHTMRLALVQAGGIDTAITIMRDFHPTHECIQRVGFLTLYNLCENAHHGALIFQRGGFRTIQNAQRVCPWDPFIERYAWTLLVKLVVLFFVHWGVWIMHHV